MMNPPDAPEITLIPSRGGMALRLAIPARADGGSSRVTLRLYTIQGRLAATLIDGRIAAGYHRVGLDAALRKGVSSGYYLCRLSVDGTEQSAAVMIMR